MSNTPHLRALAVAVARARALDPDSESPYLCLNDLKGTEISPSRFLTSAAARPIRDALIDQGDLLPYNTRHARTVGTFARGPLALAYFLKEHPEAYLELWDLIKDQVQAYTGNPFPATGQATTDRKPEERAVKPVPRMFPPHFYQRNPGYVEVVFAPTDRSKERGIIERSAPEFIDYIPIGNKGLTTEELLMRFEELPHNHIVAMHGDNPDGRYASNLRLVLRRYLKHKKNLPAVIE